MAEKKIVIVDADIPFIQGVLEHYAHVSYVKANAINREVVQNADALIVRTRTQCTSDLLQGTKVLFIGTATIGTDHIDLDYCRRAGITVVSAAGGNASAVAQYVVTALLAVAQRLDEPVAGKTLGIVGVGNVGFRLAMVAEALGMRVLLNDPPRALREGPSGFVNLKTILAESDVISLHLPLQEDTIDLAGESFFASMHKRPILINSSRGATVNEAALMKHRDKMRAVVLDVWKNEPDIDKKLLGRTTLATPHIAGYSLEGKRNATMMIVRELSSFFAWTALISFTLPTLPVEDCYIAADNLYTQEEVLCQLFNKIFPIFEEDLRLRSAPENFEAIRSAYIYRREPSGYRVTGPAAEMIPQKVLKILGFKF